MERVREDIHQWDGVMGSPNDPLETHLSSFVSKSDGIYMYGIYHPILKEPEVGPISKRQSLCLYTTSSSLALIKASKQAWLADETL